jgi:hypothetical protein
MARGPLGVTRAGGARYIGPPRPGTIDFALRSIRGGKYRVMELASSAVRFEPRLQPIAVAWETLTPWLVASAFPSVVAASVKRAKTSGGFRDRQLLIEHMASLVAAKRYEQPRTDHRKNADRALTDRLAFLRKIPEGGGPTH